MSLTVLSHNSYGSESSGFNPITESWAINGATLKRKVLLNEVETREEVYLKREYTISNISSSIWDQCSRDMFSDQTDKK